MELCRHVFVFWELQDLVIAGLWTWALGALSCPFLPFVLGRFLVLLYHRVLEALDLLVSQFTAIRNLPWV